MNYRGVEALQAGVLVAFTQLMPEHQIQLFYLLKMRVKVRSYLLFALFFGLTHHSC